MVVNPWDDQLKRAISGPRPANVSRSHHDRDVSEISAAKKPDIPFRTFTCTEEYPFVTFLTLRTTLDMMPVYPRRSTNEREEVKVVEVVKLDQKGRGIRAAVSCQALTAHLVSRLRIAAQGVQGEYSAIRRLV